METRRLAILCSHLCPIASGSRQTQASISIRCSASDDQPSSRDATNGNQPRNCVFCKIVRGDSPAHKLYEDDMCLCILDTKPLIHGHSLVIPKSHFCSLEATPPSVVAAMCSKVPFIGNAIMKATGCDSFNLVVNNGEAAGQVIFHTHMHIIPRKNCDGLWSTESLRRCPLNFDQKSAQFVDHVREQLSDIFEDRKGQESNPS
ncbi:adenylylsulfatase HINT3 isoform X2 [Tripterygium wilfordii]|uniref:adenylylsulfatase HINT3 isoform X2 n=1 Tax=Tripterygium wilfordii TaxID=458696 RepID=UPI0018F82A9F|nr:adenylylsulfatase HINT3 isoform X2 [Tripterygium wilfordii]